MIMKSAAFLLLFVSTLFAYTPYPNLQEIDRDNPNVYKLDVHGNGKNLLYIYNTGPNTFALSSDTVVDYFYFRYHSVVDINKGADNCGIYTDEDLKNNAYSISLLNEVYDYNVGWNAPFYYFFRDSVTGESTIDLYPMSSPFGNGSIVANGALFPNKIPAGEWFEIEIPCEGKYLENAAAIGLSVNGQPHDNTSTEFDITDFVKKIHQPPYFTTIFGSDSGVEDTAWGPLQINALNSDGDSLSLAVSANHAEVYLTGSSGNWSIDSIVPEPDFFGEVTVNVQLRDSFDLITETFNIEFLPVNDRPTVENVVIEINQGETKTVNLNTMLNYTLGPENEEHDSASIRIVNPNHESFAEELSVKGMNVVVAIGQKALEQTIEVNGVLYDGGGVDRGGVDSTEFILQIQVLLTETTQIRIDSIVTVNKTETAVTTASNFDTLYINDTTATIYFNYREAADTLLVVNGIIKDTTVAITARALEDKYPGSKLVTIKYNATVPVIKFHPVDSGMQTRFGNNSRWLTMDSLSGSFTEVDGSIDTLWTNRLDLEINEWYSIVNERGQMIVDSGRISLDTLGIVPGINEICISRKDVYGNSGEKCLMILYSIAPPKIEFINPAESNQTVLFEYMEVEYLVFYDRNGDLVDDTTMVNDPVVRTFNDAGVHTITVEYRNRYGTLGMNTRDIEYVLIGKEITIDVAEAVRHANGAIWSALNPEQAKSRVFILNTKTEEYIDKGTGVSFELEHEQEYVSAGFEIDISVELPELKGNFVGELNWHIEANISYYVYDLLGQFVSKHQKTFAIDDPDFVGADGKVYIKDQILPQRGEMVHSDGRRLGSGVYLIHGRVDIVSTPVAESLSGVSPIYIESRINLKQGYVRDKE
ncbi:MAG: hypothetical protein OCD76_12185 [Reichenbachiella sp.]